MFACSTKPNDLAFARQLAEQHPREVAQFFDPNTEKVDINALAAVIATFASNNADIDAYTAENFLPYLKSLLEMEVSQKDFDNFQEMYNYLKDDLSFFVYTENTDREEGTRKLVEEEAKDLYVTFKDSDGNIYALLKTPKLNADLGSPKDKAVKALRKMATEKAEYQGKNGKKTIWKYLDRIIEAVSVSYDANPNADYNGVPKIAAALGNTIDAFVRDFFDSESVLYRFANNREELSEDDLENLMDEYKGNLSLRTIESLVDDLHQLKRQIESEFGENCTVISSEIELFGQKKNGEWIHGIPDLLVVDNQGIVHVVDVKTSKINAEVYDEDKISEEKNISYGKQVTRYIRLLESYGFTVDPRPMLCIVDTYYDQETLDFEVEKTKFGDKVQQITIRLEDGTRVSLGEYEAHNNTPVNRVAGMVEKPSNYAQPALHRESMTSDMVDALLEAEMDDTVEDYKKQLDAMTEDERILFTEFVGDPSKQQQNQMRTPRSKIVKPNDGLYSHPELLSESEIQYVANHIMLRATEIIDELIAGIAHPKLTDKTFTGQTSEQVIKGLATPGKSGIYNLLDYVAGEILKYDPNFPTSFDEDYYDSEEDWKKDFILNQKRAIYTQNLDALYMAGFAKLKRLEPSVTLIPRNQQSQKEDKTDDEETVDRGDNESIEAEQEKKDEGITDIEAWMLGDRHYSTKASLAEELKRIFDRLIVFDDRGKAVTDRFGYGFREHVDSTMAIESILEWCQYCESFDEMHGILESHVASDPWVKSILQAVDSNPNVKKKFYRHFRKDMTKYCVCRTRYENGRRIVITEVINTKSSYDIIRRSLFLDFKNFRVPFYDAESYINKDKVRKGLEDIKEIRELLKAAYKEIRTSNPEFDKLMQDRLKKDKIAEKISAVLQGIGVKGAIASIVYKTMIQKLNSPQKNNAMSMCNLAYAILNGTISRLPSGERGINPLQKGSKTSGVIKTYDKILKMIAGAVQEHVESSVYNDGKTYYSFNNPSYLGSVIRNLKNAAQNDEKFDKYLEDNFLKYKGWFTDYDGQHLNKWLELLSKSDDPRYREMLDYKTELTYDRTQYKELGGLGFQLSILHEYFGKKGEDPDGSAWYALPTMSNKPVSEFIRFVKFNNTSDIVREILEPTFRQELNRITDVLEHWTNDPEVNTDHYDLTDKNLKKVLSDTDDLSAIKERARKGELTVEDMAKITKAKSGAKFHFLWYLNSEFANNTDFAKQVVAKLNSKIQGTSTDTFEIKLQDVYDTISTHMEEVVQKELDNMRRLGLFEKQTIKVKEKNVEVLKYQREFQNNELGTTEEEMEEALKNFIWNDIAANINIIQLTGTDLAYYGNSVNYQKRIAQIHSPGLWMYNDKDDEDGLSDGFLRSIHVSDEKVNGKDVISEVTENAIAALEEYKDSLPEEQQNEMEMMIKVIRAGFNDFDITDGQSYSCPTSLRKKLSAMGEWTDEMEEAYGRIRSGNFNINDLGIVWQPMKPFVTAQLTKYSGTHGMTIRKTPLQDKNSEYLLLLAEALSEGSGRKSKLSAIYHFMEDTAYGDGKGSGEMGVRKGKDITTYNKRGIDTVHFVSVGKVGVSGVIDIRGGISPEEVYRRLHDAVHRTEPLDEEGRKLGLDEYYDDQYVDTYPIERYIVQQEVPIHLTDEHRQLYGSQIRILGISDIDDDATGFGEDNLTKDQLITEYKELQAANIKASFEELMDDLGLNDENISNEEKRIRLSRILQEELAKDDKYGYDIKKACQLERDPVTGELDFVIPLLDPIQATRIQMLLNSIIKKRINKQKIYGGSLVQTTAYDQDLSIVFQDAKGNRIPTFKQWLTQNKGKTAEDYREYLKEKQASIMYYECYMPMHPLIEKYGTNPDGSMMRFDELFDTIDETGKVVKKGKIPQKIQKNLLEMVGYRIPTEDKYSMVPLRVKGFLPKAAGQTLMMPKEITLLTGSDFDIDKIYVMMKSFKVNDISDADVVEGYKKEHPSTKLSTEEIEKMIKGMRNGTLNTDLREMRGFVKWYKQYVISNMLELYENMESENAREAREARNNRIIDLQWAVLTHKDTVKKMVNPGNFNIQKKTGRIIKVLRAQQRGEIETDYTFEELSQMFDEKGADALDGLLEFQDEHSVTLPSSKIYFQQQNMQGAQMVGIFANHNVSHAFVSFQKIGIDLGDKAFYFGGRLLGSSNSIMQLDKLEGFDGKLISKTIAEFLAASVDTAKDPTLRDMNVNTFTGTVAMALARLGYDTATIGMFLAQPIILKLTDYFFKMKNENSFYSGDTAVKEVWVDTFNQKKENLDDLSIINSDMGMGLTLENLAETIGDDADADSQQKVLVAFKQLLSIANDINELTFCTKFNSVSNASGPTIADTQLKEDRVRRFRDRVTAGKSIFYVPESDNSWDDADNVINNEPLLRAFYNYTINSDESTGEEIGASYQIFNEYFANYFPGFQSIKDIFTDDYTKSGRISSKVYNKLLNDYIFYLLTLEDPSRGIKPILPYDKKDLEYIVEHSVEFFEKVAAKKDRKPNLILDEGLGNNCLHVRKKDEYLATDVLIFYGGQLDAEKQDEIKAAWSDLITSEDPEIREFGNLLFFYTLQKNGFGFSARTLMHLASVVVRQNATFSDNVGENERFSSYLDGLRSLASRDKALIDAGFEDRSVGGEFLDQFVRNHANDFNIVPSITLDDTTEFNRDGSLTIKVDISNGKPLRGQTIIDDNKACPYILAARRGFGANAKVITSIYRLRRMGNDSGINKGNGEATMIYEPITKLGLTNNFIEYNANGDIETSYFEDMRNKSEASFDVETGDNTTNGSEEDADLNYKADYEAFSNANLSRFVLRRFFPNTKDKATRQLQKALAAAIRESVKTSDTKEELTNKIKQSAKEALQKADVEMSDEDFENLVDSIEKYCKDKLNLC